MSGSVGTCDRAMLAVLVAVGVVAAVGVVLVLAGGFFGLAVGGPGKVTETLRVWVSLCLRLDRLGWVGVLAMSFRSCVIEEELEEEELEEELSFFGSSSSMASSLLESVVLSSAWSTSMAVLGVSASLYRILLSELITTTVVVSLTLERLAVEFWYLVSCDLFSRLD
jgi:hypothetical protein